MKAFIKNKLEKIGIRLNFVRNLWYQDSFQLLKKLCRKSSPVIFDIGASDGASVVDFKNIFPDALMYSFEPYPSAFEGLNTLAKSYSDIHAFQIALSDKNGELDFYVNKSKATNSLLKPKKTESFADDHAVLETCIQVPTRTLDSFVAEHQVKEIDILKIDVQGGEILVLEGAKETLRQKNVKIIYTEIWFIEGYAGQPLYHDVATFLATYGYYPFGIYNMHYRNDGHFLWGDAIFYLK